MDYRQLGRTDLNVSAICLGTMTWGEQNTEAEAFAQIERAKEAGINFIDTAEPGFRLVRQETQGRKLRYTLESYAVGRAPEGARYAP